MFSFWKKKEPILNLEQEIQTSSISSISLLISQDKNVKVVCAWPKSYSKEEELELAQTYAKLIINFFSEDMLKYILPSIVNHGSKTGTESMTQTMMGLMENIMLEKKKKDEESPIVSPIELFKVRG